MSDPAADALRTTSDVLALAAAALPPPLGIVARILSAAAGAASVAVDSGRTEAEVVASIRRIDAIDVAGQDAAADDRIRRRREEEARRRREVIDATTSPAVLAERSGIAQRPYGCAECGTAIALVGDPMPAVGTRCTRCEAQARTERGDEPTRETR